MPRHRYEATPHGRRCIHCGLETQDVWWWGVPLRLWRHPMTRKVRNKKRAPWRCSGKVEEVGRGV